MTILSTFHGLVLCGKLRTAVRWITEREKGGGIAPGGEMHKDRGTRVGGAPRKTPRRTAPVCSMLRRLPGEATRDGPGGHHGRRDVGGS